MGLRDRLRQLSTSTDEMHARSIAHQLVALDVTHLSDVEPRCHVRVAGEVTRIRTRPATGVPVLEVRISDGGSNATVEWNGRQTIGGVTLGRRILIEGVARRDGRRLIFANPEYTLLA